MTAQIWDLLYIQACRQIQAEQVKPPFQTACQGSSYVGCLIITMAWTLRDPMLPFLRVYIAVNELLVPFQECNVSWRYPR